MGALTEALGKTKKSTFGKIPTRGNFGKKKSYIKKKSKKHLATPDERDQLEWMKEANFPCFICGRYDRNQNHHLKLNETEKIHNSSCRKDHTKLVPVCWEHHFGDVASFHGNRKGLEKLYTKESLLIISGKYRENYLDFTS